jgi:hypothetical protein
MTSYENAIQLNYPNDHRYFFTIDGCPMVILESMKVPTDDFWYPHVFSQIQISVKPGNKLMLVHPMTSNMSIFEIEIFQGIVSITQHLGSFTYLDQILKNIYSDIIRCSPLPIINEITLKIFYYGNEEYKSNDFSFQKKTNTNIFGNQWSNDKLEYKKIVQFQNACPISSLSSNKLDTFMDLAIQYMRGNTPPTSIVPTSQVLSTSPSNSSNHLYGSYSSPSAFQTSFGTNSSTTSPSAFNSGTSPSAFNSGTSPSAFNSGTSPSAFNSGTLPSAFNNNSSFGSTSTGNNIFGTSPTFKSSVFGTAYKF